MLVEFIMSTDVAIKLSERDPEWRMPVLWRFEVANVVMRMCRAGQIDWESALRMLLEAGVNFEDCEEDVRAADAGIVVQQSGLTAYDASYVALAKKLQCKMVTWDREILKKIPELALSPENFIGGS